MRTAKESISNPRGLLALPPARSSRGGFRRCAPRATLTHGPLTAGTARGLASAAMNSGLLKGQWGPAVLHLATGGLLAGPGGAGIADGKLGDPNLLAGLPPAAAAPAGGRSGAAPALGAGTCLRCWASHACKPCLLHHPNCLPAAGQLASHPWQGPGEAAWLTMASLFTLAASFSECAAPGCVWQKVACAADAWGDFLCFKADFGEP